MDTIEKPHGYLAGAFCQVVPIIQRGARPLGYAVAVHGSMNRDLDLIAAPWVVNPAPPARLHAMVANTFSPYSPEHVNREVYGPELKPHGRLSWTIPLVGGAAIDLSVMPPDKFNIDSQTHDLTSEAYRLINEGEPELAKRCLLEILGKLT